MTDRYLFTLIAIMTTLQVDSLLHSTACLIKHLEIHMRTGHTEQCVCCVLLSAGLIQIGIRLS